MPRLRRAISPPSIGVRALAAALIGLMVGAYTAAVRHEVTVEHVVCAEHGELVDVEVGAPGVIDRDAQLRDGSPDPHAARAHAHCGFAALTHGAVTPSLAAVACAARVRSAPSSVSWPAAPPAAIPALHLAPKTSPPHAVRSSS